MRREARKELGIELNSLKLFRRYEQQHADGLHEIYVYEAPLHYPLDELRSQQTEGDGLGLFTLDEIKKKTNVLKQDIEILEDLLS